MCAHHPVDRVGEVVEQVEPVGDLDSIRRPGLFALYEPDFALVDELEKGENTRRRITVAY